MAKSMAMRSVMRYEGGGMASTEMPDKGMMKKSKPKKIKVDGKEYDLEDFNDTRRWSK